MSTPFEGISISVFGGAPQGHSDRSEKLDSLLHPGWRQRPVERPEGQLLTTILEGKGKGRVPLRFRQQNIQEAAFLAQLQVERFAGRVRHCVKDQTQRFA